MARRNIYFKEKIEREVQELVEIEIQNGATHGEINFSSMVNDLVNVGLIIKKHQGEGNAFDEEGFNRDLIRKVAGTREGVSILTAMVTELYLHMRGEISDERIGEVLNENLTAISQAEKDAESKHFIQKD